MTTTTYTPTDYATGLVAYHGRIEAVAIAIAMLREAGLTVDEGREAFATINASVGWQNMAEYAVDAFPSEHTPAAVSVANAIDVAMTKHFGDRR